MAGEAVTAWLLEPVPRARVAWMRTFLYAFIWADVLVLRPWVRLHGDVPGILYKPLAIGNLFHLPTPTHTFTLAVMLLLLTASAVCATGRSPRALGILVAFLYLEWMVIAFSYGKVDHDRFGFLVALFVLPTVGAASHDDRRPDERAGWALRCIQLGAVATYFLAVIAKARYGHGLFTWMNSTTLLRAVVRRGTFIADPLMHNPWTLHVTQWFIIALELASPLLLVRGRVGRWMLITLATFHAVTFACLTIAFWPHLMTLLAFVPLERLKTPNWRRILARSREIPSPVRARAG
jgi:hypothetical protein